MKNVQKQRFFWSVFSCIRPEYRPKKTPYLDAFHTVSTNKIRDVFECSAEFQVKFINTELMSGTGITDQIIGALTRFYAEKIAFMADEESCIIKSMFLRISSNFGIHVARESLKKSSIQTM